MPAAPATLNTAPPAAIKDFRCPECGGDRVGWDAYSNFDPVTQSEVLGGSYDDGWCNDCGEVKPEEYEITDPAEVAAILDLRRVERIKEHAAALLELVSRAEEDWGEAFDGDEPMNGGDCCDWLCRFIEDARILTAKLNLPIGGEPTS